MALLTDMLSVTSRGIPIQPSGGETPSAPKERAPAYTLKPFDARYLATARPNPEEAPETNITLLKGDTPCQKFRLVIILLHFGKVKRKGLIFPSKGL
jgi:hypothetical protein